jgi:hypothetical protein
MLGTNMENVDAPSISQANELSQDVLDPSVLKYDVPSVSSHAYSNMNTPQPSTIEDPQGNNQAHTLSHLSNMMVCCLFFLYFFLNILGNWSFVAIDICV